MFKSKIITYTQMYVKYVIVFMKCKTKTYLICINETSFKIGGFHMNLYRIISL